LEEGDGDGRRAVMNPEAVKDKFMRTFSPD
jgi:hypothetical protein